MLARRPDEDDGAFAGLVGRYAAELDAGRMPPMRGVDARAPGWEAADADAGAGAEP